MTRVQKGSPNRSVGFLLLAGPSMPRHTCQRSPRCTSLRKGETVSTRLIATQREHLVLMCFSELPEVGEGTPPSENAPFSLKNTPGAQEVNTPYVVTLAPKFFLRKHFTCSPFNRKEGKQAFPRTSLHKRRGSLLRAAFAASTLQFLNQCPAPSSAQLRLRPSLTEKERVTCRRAMWAGGPLSPRCPRGAAPSTHISLP